MKFHLNLEKKQRQHVSPITASPHFTKSATHCFLFLLLLPNSSQRAPSTLQSAVTRDAHQSCMKLQQVARDGWHSCISCSAASFCLNFCSYYLLTHTQNCISVTILCRTTNFHQFTAKGLRLELNELWACCSRRASVDGSC